VPTYAPTTGVAQARPNGADDPFAAFDASIASSLFGRGALTVSVAVAKDGRLVHTQAFGTTNPFTGEAASIYDRFRIASVSKTLLAVAVLRLVDEGKLALDQPVGDRLIGILGTTPGDPAIATITLRQLLSHTGGFAEYQRTFFGGDVSSCEEAAAAALRRPLVGAPGTVYGYSNLNYCLLGLLVQDVTGESYEKVVQREVLDPLHIDDMRVAGTFDVRDGDVVHPTGQGRTFMEALGASGNWIGTASDLVKVIDAIDPAKPGPHLLGPTWLPEMTVRAPVTYPHVDSWYGLGLIVWDNGTAWGHTGTVESARTMVFHRPDGITWAILVNGPSPSYSADLRKYMDQALATVTTWPA
jgi:D-alanyl-D-alanine carboxypeptidase